MESMGFWPEVRGYFLLLILNVIFILLIINCCTIITGEYILLPAGNVWIWIWIWISALALALLNYYFILHKGKWGIIIKEFDKLPKKKNQIGTIIIWSIIFIEIFTYFYSLFYLYQMDY